MADDFRDALETLIRDSIEHVVSNEEALLEQRGAVAIYNTARDSKFKALTSFRSAASATAALPHFNERIGSESAERLTLQVVYEYFNRAAQLDFDVDAFTRAVDGFTSELAKPTWMLVMVANLEHFESEDQLVDFGDGMTFRGRNFDELRDRLGWTDQHLEALTQDWMRGFGASEHVVWLEQEVEKSPETLVQANTAQGQEALSRLLLALWLYKEGDINIGTIFNAEAASFSPRASGAWRSIRPTGFGQETYALSASEAAPVREIYDKLVLFDQESTVPQNVRLAFRSFTSIYARGLHQREDRVLDSITALEALLGAKEELAFKLAFRVASILADGDDERAELLSRVKQFYATRSRIVHGGNLRQADLDLVSDDTPLRSVLRQVLRAVLHLAAVEKRHLSQHFVDSEIDAILVHAENREALRREMGLV